MMVLALLLAIANQADIVEHVAKVPPVDWTPRRLSLRKPGAVDIAYRMESGGAGVRLLLIAHKDESKLGAQREIRQLAATDFAESGRLQVHLAEAGEYSLVIDNRLETKKTAAVRFKGTILYDSDPLSVRTLSWERRLVVITSSLSVFFAVCFLAGRRIWRAMVERGIREVE